jgi:hypothetical protein
MTEARALDVIWVNVLKTKPIVKRVSAIWNALMALEGRTEKRELVGLENVTEFVQK